MNQNLPLGFNPHFHISPILKDWELRWPVRQYFGHNFRTGWDFLAFELDSYFSEKINIFQKSSQKELFEQKGTGNLLSQILSKSSQIPSLNTKVIHE